MRTWLLGIALHVLGPSTTEQLGVRLGELGLDVYDNWRIEYPTWAFSGEAPLGDLEQEPVERQFVLGVGRIAAAIEALSKSERQWLDDCHLRTVTVGVAAPAGTTRGVTFDLGREMLARLAAAGVGVDVRVFPEPLGNLEAMNMPARWAEKLQRR